MSAFLREYGVAATIDGVPLVTKDAVDFKANPTLAAGDVKISKDGGTFANLTTLPAATPASGSSVRISLSATEMQASRVVIQFVDQTAPKEWEDQQVVIETHSHSSAEHQFGEDIFDVGYYDAIDLALASTLTTYRLDHLMASSVTGADVADDSVIAKLVSKAGTADFDTFDNTTDSLEAIRDRGDAAWIDAGGASPFLLVDTTVATVNSQTDFDLTAGPNLNSSLEGLVIVFYDASNSDAPSARQVATYTGSGPNVTISNLFSQANHEPDFTVVAGDKVRVFAVPFLSAVDLRVLGLDINLETNETPITGTPTANSIHERLKTLDDAYTAARAALIDNLDATVSSRSTLTAAQAADQVWDESRAAHLIAGSFGEGVIVNGLGANAEAQVLSNALAALDTAVGGSPTAGSINERVKAIDDKLPSGNLVGDDTATPTRLGYLDKLNITGNVASSGEVTAIQNNTRVRVIVPAVMERPDSASQTFRFWLYLYDTEGNMEAPDSTPTVEVRNQVGVDRSGNLGTVQFAGTGSYYVDYTVADTHFIEQLLVEWTVTENTVIRYHGAATFVVDTTAVDFTASDRSDLAAIKTKTDQLAFTAGDVKATLDGEVVEVALTGDNTDDIELACATALTAFRLDHLMAAAVTGADVEDDSVIAKLFSKSGTADYDTYDNTTDSLEALADSGGGGPTAATIADAVWDEATADHVAAGSFGAGVNVESLNTNAETQVYDKALETLVSLGLDHLMAAAVAGADVVDDSVIAKLSSKSGTADFDTFNNTTDSLEALADAGGGGGGGPTAAVIADAIAQELIADHSGTTGSLFEAIQQIRAAFVNRSVANKVSGRTTVYDDDGTTVLYERDLIKGASEAEVEYVTV